MSALILKLVHESVQKSYYKKAIECILALREGCIQEEESEQFNTFMGQVKKFFKDKRRHDFWLMLVQNKISLITQDESDDSEVSSEVRHTNTFDWNIQEARNFLHSGTEEEEEKKKSSSSSSEMGDDGEHDAESLFKLIE